MPSPKIIPFPVRRRSGRPAKVVLALLEVLVTAAIGICTVLCTLVFLTML